MIIMPAPRTASVGARAAPISRASQMFMAVNRASASRVPRGDRQRRPDAGQPQVQPRVRAQVMQPDPGRIREQHQDKGDLRQ